MVLLKQITDDVNQYFTVCAAVKSVESEMKTVKSRKVSTSSSP